MHQLAAAAVASGGSGASACELGKQADGAVCAEQQSRLLGLLGIWFDGTPQHGGEIGQPAHRLAAAAHRHALLPQ